MSSAATHPLRAVAALSAPLTGFFLLQNMIGLVTLAFIGRLGDAALAGVGVANALHVLLLALTYGLDTGVQALVSRATGAGRRGALGRIVRDGVALGVLIGVVAVLTAWMAGPAVIRAIMGPGPAAIQGGAFLIAAAPAILLQAITIPVNAGWIGSGRPGIAFGVSALTAPVQLALGWLLIGRIGAAGAGLALTSACFVGLVAQLALATRLVPMPGILQGRPSAAGMAAVARLGWPVSIQQSLLQACLAGVFAIIAKLGVADVAVINVLNNLMLLPIQLGTGMGVAAATLVGQALGRGAAREAAGWGWRTARWGAIAVSPVGLALLLAPRAVLGVFIAEPATLALAVWPARMLGLMVGVDAFARVIGFALRGAGATRSATVVPFVTQCVLLLPAMAWIGVSLGYGLKGVVGVQVAMVLAETLAYAVIWRLGRWARVDLPSGPEAASPPSAPDAPPRRVAILGGAGAGKSTLARQLGERLGLPVVHLDRVVFDPGWRRVEAAVARERLAALLPSDAWIVEGTYRELADLTLPNADLVLWLDQPTWLRLLRAWGKTRDPARPRTDRPDGCPEAFGPQYLRTILRFGRLTAKWEAALRRAVGRGRLLRLRGDREVAAFVESLRVSASRAA